MRKVATVLEANRLEGNDLFTWVQHRAKAAGKYMAAETAQSLVNTVGDQLILLASEIEKMATYLGDEVEITEELIQEIVTRTPEDNVFKLTESYLLGDIPRTIATYHDLLRNEEEPIMLTALIAGQIRLMIHVQSLRQKGYQQKQIADTLKVHWYRVKLIMDNRRLPTTERLMVVLQQLAHIDHQLKTTSGNRERLLELFLMTELQAI